MNMNKPKRRIASTIAAVAAGLALAIPAAAGSHLDKAEADILGKNIHDSNGRKIGEVEDLMADLDASRITYVIVSGEELTGDGDTWIALPWGAVGHSPDGKTATIAVPIDGVKRAPRFDEDNFPSMTDAKWAADVYACCNKEPYWTKGSPAKAPSVYRMSEILGWDVRNSKNENLGEIEEMVVDCADGDIEYAVLSFGGVLGIGEKYFAIVPDSLRVQPADKKFVFDIDKERLKNAPGFDKKDWPDMASTDFRTRVTDFYGGSPAVKIERNRDIDKEETAMASPVHAARASETIGTTVKNSRGETLGDVEDLVVDLSEGRIAYAVLSFGGFLGMGDKLFAVPTEAFRRAADGKTLVLDVDKERLKNAPGFDKTLWPSLSDRKWLNSVYEYYGSEPYWRTPASPQDER